MLVLLGSFLVVAMVCWLSLQVGGVVDGVVLIVLIMLIMSIVLILIVGDVQIFCQGFEGFDISSDRDFNGVSSQLS